MNIFVATRLDSFEYSEVCFSSEWCFTISVNKYSLELVSMYLCTNYRMEEFVIALANYAVLQGVGIPTRHFPLNAALLYFLSF